MPESMPMISRRPMWMLLVTCALLSSGVSTMAMAASEEGRWAQGAHSRRGELLLSQATETSEEQSENEETQGETNGDLERPTLSLGSNGPLVIQVQVLLQEQDLYNGTVNGDFDDDTVTAVKEFQTINDLEPTGSVDSATWGPLTGEIAAPETEAPEEASPSPEAESNDGAPSSKLRLLIAAAALVGLGAGGFGLWKVLAVPVPQPLAYPEEDDEDEEYEYVDDLDGGKAYVSQAIEPIRQAPSAQPNSPITLSTASLAAQSAQADVLHEEIAEELEEEERFDFSELDEIDLPEAPVEETIAATGNEAVVMQAPTQQRFETVEVSPVETLVESIHGEVDPSQEFDPDQEAARQPQIALQQAVVKDATGQDFAESKVAAMHQTLKKESATDTAVAIATQSMKAAARRQTSKTTAPKTTAKKTVKKAPSAAKVPPAKGKSRATRTAKAAAKTKSGLAKSRSAKPVRSKAGRVAPPPPPPAPSKIVRAQPVGALEQPELVTNPIMGRTTDIVETLITDLQGADPAKRRKAIWELGQRCDSRAIQPLVNMMTNSDSRQRSLILAALSEIGTQTLKPMKQALAISLQDENAEVRKNAIRDLTRIYDLVAQISHLLTSALDDPDPEVQDTARWALKQLNRIRANTGLEGSADQPILQQSVSPPESFSGEETLKPKSLPKV